VRRHRQAEQAQIADHVRHAAVEEHRPCFRLRQAIGAHLPAQHQLGEGRRIDPGQRRAADRHLVLDDAAPGLDRTGIARPLQRIDQRALARARAAGNDDEAVGIRNHAARFSRPC
jgi:hypothetical protein